MLQNIRVSSQMSIQILQIRRFDEYSKERLTQQRTDYSILSSSSSSFLSMRSIFVCRVLDEEKQSFITKGKRLAVETNQISVKTVI